VASDPIVQLAKDLVNLMGDMLELPPESRMLNDEEIKDTMRACKEVIEDDARKITGTNAS
jgi:hypothetical protein